MDKQLIERLRAQADEIASQGCAGLGNTMRDAADELERIDAELGKEAAGSALLSDYRILEIIRGYKASLSDSTSGPDMHSERHQLAICKLAIDEARAGIPLTILESAQGEQQ